MKKLFVWIALLCCVGVLAGCAPKNPPDDIPEATEPQKANALSEKYSIQRMTIDGIGIGKFVIVSKGGTYSTAAKLLQNAVKEATGYVPEITAGSQVKEGTPAIVLCSSGYGSSAQYAAPNGGYGIYSDGTNVYICGSDEMMELYGAKQFVYSVMGYNTKHATAQNALLKLEKLNVTGTREAVAVSEKEEFFTWSEKVMDITGPFPEDMTYNTLQGCCSDGKYAYFCLLDKATDTAGCSVFKYDMSDWSLVKVNYNVQVGHGNSMCYVASRDQLMVVNYSSSMEVHFLDTQTLEIVDSKMLPFETYCAAYDPERDEYVFGVKAAKKFYVLDGDFNLLRASDIKSAAGDQSVYCDSRYIYFIYYNPNCIVIYDWDTNYVNTVYLDTTIEVESGFVKDGVLYLAYYISPGKGGQLYRTEIF